MLNFKAIILAVVAAVAFSSAWIVQDWRYAAKEADRLEAQRERERANAMTADKASEAHEEAKVAIQTEFKTIYQEVERVVEKPIYRNVCFDDDGMRQLRAAIGNPAATGQPSPAVR